MDLKLSVADETSKIKPHNSEQDNHDSISRNEHTKQQQQKYQETRDHLETSRQSCRLSFDDEVPSCRICHCTESPSSGMVKLISPCHCSGSLKYVHHGCLQQWLDATNSQTCELCKQPFSITIKYKPLYKWNALNASPGERRRLICNSVFNLVSMVCIFWSIYVLIERASLDAKNGQIDWSFYVKISVVTIGLIIGVIFLFVQLKLYFTIFMKWRQSNRIIVIRNSNYVRPIPNYNNTPSQNNTTTIDTTRNTSITSNSNMNTIISNNSNNNASNRDIQETQIINPDSTNSKMSPTKIDSDTRDNHLDHHVIHMPTRQSLEPGSREDVKQGDLEMS